MNNISYDILNHISEGIVILKEDLEIFFWNYYIEKITGISQQDAIGRPIFEILPNLSENCFKKSFEQIKKNGCNMFFSAAMHRSLINDKRDFNLKISYLQMNGSPYFLLEFIDVTNQFIRIGQLKESLYELHQLNKKLKEKEEYIKNLAYYDPLTRVANRNLFYKLAKELLNTVNRDGHLLALLFIDVDNLKEINDTYGHEVGDRILQEVANTLKKSTRKSDVITRFGGDEFLILLPYTKSAENYNKVASRIIGTGNKVKVMDAKDISITFSIGISLYPDHGNHINELILKADEAMYIAKRNGGNQYFVLG